MVSGAFTEGEEKLLLLLMLGQDTTISRAQAAEIGQRLGRSGDTVSLPFIMPGNKWDEARNAEVAMLFAFIDILKDGGKMTDFEGVAAKLGEGFTEAGVRQKFYKLKKESEKLLAENGEGAASAAPSTPASTNKVTKTPKSSGKRKAVANAGDPTADDDTAATPSKRTKKSNTKIKNEPEAEEVVKSESDGGEANGDAEAEASTANGSD